MIDSNESHTSDLQATAHAGQFTVGGNGRAQPGQAQLARFKTELLTDLIQVNPETRNIKIFNEFSFRGGIPSVQESL